VKLKIKH